MSKEGCAMPRASVQQRDWKSMLPSAPSASRCNILCRARAKLVPVTGTCRTGRSGDPHEDNCGTVGMHSVTDAQAISRLGSAHQIRGARRKAVADGQQVADVSFLLRFPAAARQGVRYLCFERSLYHELRAALLSCLLAAARRRVRHLPAKSIYIRMY